MTDTCSICGTANDRKHEAWCPNKWEGGAMKEQVGGDHYKDCKIQPLEYAYVNSLDICEHAIIKYATRHRKKGGIEDLQKIIHYARCEAQIVYGEDI